jgi:hypothetical protein
MFTNDDDIRVRVASRLLLLNKDDCNDLLKLIRELRDNPLEEHRDSAANVAAEIIYPDNGPESTGTVIELK